MQENDRWQVGQEVNWPKVEPYTIVQLVGKAGNIHISETGHWHTYWHSNPRHPASLVHNGGPGGFSDIRTVKHQHERVILQYTGVSIKLEPEDVAVGQQLTLPGLAEKIQTINIPGEQQSISTWVSTLQSVSRDIPQIREAQQLDVIKQSLEGLIFRTNLGRSINVYKKAANDALSAGLLGGRAQFLGGVTEAQRQLLLRGHETVLIVAGIMNRHDDLDRLQTSWNRTVLYLPYMYGRTVANLERGVWDDYLKRTMHAEILGEQSAFARLEKLKGEPYFSRAQAFLRNRRPIIRSWERKLDSNLLKVLKKQAKDAEVWKRYVEDELTGIDFGKYALV